jgi:uncharacterized membrane protein
VNRLPRVGVSLISACAAQLLTGAVLSARDGFTLFGERLFGFVYFSILLIYPGWLIAVPFVICNANLRGKDLYRMAAIGFFIGPGLILSIAVGFALATQAAIQIVYVGRYAALASIVSALSTSFYVIGLKTLDGRTG